jgi:hypothetical protein
LVLKTRSLCQGRLPDTSIAVDEDVPPRLHEGATDVLEELFSPSKL